MNQRFFGSQGLIRADGRASIGQSVAPGQAGRRHPMIADMLSTRVPFPTSSAKGRCSVDQAGGAIVQIAVLTFEGFNELDSFVAAAILNRMKPKGWTASIVSPTAEVTSMNGVTIERQQPLEFAREADAVIIGSGIRTREIAEDGAMLARIALDPARQLVAAQCSGTLLMAKLGLVGDLPACTDLVSKPWVIEAGVTVIDAPFVAHGNVATAGGCLASQYIAAWLIARMASVDDAIAAIHYVAPVGEKDAFVARAMAAIAPFLPADERLAA